MPLYGYADGRNYLLMPAAKDNPLALSMSGKLFTKEDAGIVQLFFLDDDGVEHQLTPASPGSIYPYQLPIIPFSPAPLAMNGKLYTREFTPPGGGEACLCFMSNAGVEYVLTPGYNQDFAPVVMSEVAIIPAVQANKGQIYAKDVAGVSQLFYLADDATETQLTPPNAATYPFECPETATPAPVVNVGKVYSKDVAGVSQLFYLADDATETQLTPPGAATYPFQCPETVTPAPVANVGKVYSKDAAGVSQLFYLADNGTEYQVTPPSPGGVGTLVVATIVDPAAGPVVVLPGTLVPLFLSAVDSTITFANGVNDGDRAAAVCYFSGGPTGGKIFINRGLNISSSMWNPANLYLDYTPGQLKAITFVWSNFYLFWALESASVY